MLFLDLNAYFASVEQQENPELRGKPVVVAPVDSDTTCAIAVSYEAKRFGIKTGTNIGEARSLCPGLIVVGGTPGLYVSYHKQVVEAVESVVPVEKVCSIDEMRCRLIGKEQDPETVRRIALRIKESIADTVGECMTSSIGVAPNAFLAKLATEMEKPNGLVILTAEEIYERTRSLQLTDFTGINRRMKARLQAAGIFSVEHLYAATKSELRTAFGSKIGERWYYLLRGFELDLPDSDRKSLGHSHVLPPALRTDKGCHDIMLRLLAKAANRMRSLNLVAGEMSVFVHGYERSWRQHLRLPATNATRTLSEEFERMWVNRDFSRPRTVGVTFSSLAPADSVTPSLFDQGPDLKKLDGAIDSVNHRFGKNSVFLAAISDVKDRATEKISFQKVELFSEGKGDNEWPNAFRGV